MVSPILEGVSKIAKTFEAFAKFGNGIVAQNGHKRHKNTQRMVKTRNQKVYFVPFVLFVVNPHFSPG